MEEGEKENNVNIFVLQTPKKYSKEFLEKLTDRRIEIINNIVRRIFLQNDI